MFLPAICLASCLVSKQPALAHEFWIEPEKYQVESGGALQVGLRNGEMFKGARLPYLDHRIQRFAYSQGSDVTPYKGRLGDMPALILEDLQPGLLVALHETTADLITYDSWEDFAAFAETQGLQDVQARHQARQLPSSGFGEFYTRHSKLLVAVGHGKGADRPFGLETEFVALQNPYTLPRSPDGSIAELPVQLLYQGSPRPKVQVELFERGADDKVQRHLLTTDEAGLVNLRLQNGRRYLLNSVVLRPVETKHDTGIPVVWETLWASMVFALPQR